MLSRSAWIARPRITLLFSRCLTGGSGGVGSGGVGSHSTTPPIPTTPAPAKTTKEARAEKMDQIMKPLAKAGPSKAFESIHYTRRFFPMDTYHPGEFDEGNARKTIDFAKRDRTAVDPFKALGIDPLKEYKNALVLSNFVTDMGRIKPRYKSGLSAKSQRRVAKAIRRARSFGLIPVTSKFDAQPNHRSLGRGGSSM
ncbi:hypothetical protein LPJ61_000028 [Coemansia biformis]|uniref:Small ribosomal subunit protein bS18m n=1 Tax=Coemansia biformis TaxID=1286918 RepID=A0A9W7YHQ8_9FUNG|nr:hypothetical protein LPJ61_000028 [Coemansia biformis]